MWNPSLLTPGAESRRRSVKAVPAPVPAKRRRDGITLGDSARRCDNGMRPMSQVVDSLDAARDAVERQAWRKAYDAYSSMDRAEFEARDLERFADAAWWTGRLEQA